MSTSAHPLRILLAEDDRCLQTLAKMVMEAAGHFVVAVETGKQAVEAVSTNSFDVVLMDCQMPEMDGFAAAKEIRKQPHNENIPIIALTGTDLSEGEDRCLDAGMDDYIVKPFNIENLKHRVDFWGNTRHGASRPDK